MVEGNSQIDNTIIRFPMSGGISAPISIATEKAIALFDLRVYLWQMVNATIRAIKIASMQNLVGFRISVVGLTTGIY